jgi:ABC-type transport system involved in multi-copper enzyme maturation permease subunit
VIAADSFVGERERKTMEALLHTPITNWELLVAKMLTAWIAAMVVSLIGFVLYALVANGFGLRILGRLFFPNLMWLLLVFWVTPGVAAIGLGLSVLLSTRVKTFQEAYQTSGIVVIPVVALMFGQVMGVMYFSNLLAAVLGLVVWVIAAVMVWLGVKTFQREKLIASL